MFRRLLFFLFLASAAFAQSASQAIAGTAADSTIRSIIVKFRAGASMSDTAILAKLQAVSAISDVMRPAFKRSSSSGMSIQSVSTDTIGLDRIMQIPLREGMLAADAVRSLSGESAFEYVEPNYFFHLQTGEVIPNDPLFEAEWWLDSIQAPEAWSVTEGDNTIHIGFVDEGVNWLHPDLAFQFAVNPAEDINHDGLFEAWPSDSVGVNARGDSITGDIDGKDHDGNGYANDVIGYNFVDDNPIPVDVPGTTESGHGTAMAGIIAAQQGNHIGISGTAPKCRLVALKAFDQTGTGQDVNIATAIIYAADNGVKILNLSFGDIIPSLLQRDAIRYAISKGVTIFGSSGNDGTTGPNYPSDFDEVVSVGATPRAGYINFTTYGQELDVVAPGVQLLTTTLDGGYNSVSGTSASCAVASGIAGLVLAHNPTLTPIELRSIMESTTEAVADRAHTANGQLDAYAALTYQGSAAIKMVTPHTLDEFHIGDTITITGDAMSTLFTGYSLSWEKDYVRDSIAFDGFGGSDTVAYDSIVAGEFDTSNSQILNGTLGTLDTHGFDTGTYTIIFAVGSSDNRSTQERCNIYMTSAPPKFVLFSVDSIWVNTQRGLLVQVTTNVPAQLDVRYTAPGANPSAIADDIVGFEHAILIPPGQAQAGVPLAIEAMLVTPNGDTTTRDTVAMIPNEAITQFPQGEFIQKSYTLPPGLALDSVLSVPAGDEVIESSYISGLLTVYKFDSATKVFEAVDSAQDPSAPQSLGNSKGTGGPELLVEPGPVPGEHVYKQNVGHSILGTIIYQNDTLLGSTFASLDSTGKQDIVGVSDSVWMAYQYNNGSYGLLGSGVDPAKPDYYNPNDNITWANVKGADLLGTGVQELVVLDNTANLIIYERDASVPTGFRVVYVDSNVASASGTLLTVGDFNGDGKPDIAYAYHPVEEQDTLDEYHPAYWTLKVLRNLGNMKFDTMMLDRFYGDNQNEHFYFGGPEGSIGRMTNVTGGKVDDLAASFFPNFYLIEYDSTTGKMRPIWNYPISQSPRGAISWDFDHNGKREFGFLAADSILFFEDTMNQSRTPAPAGFTVTPRDTNQVDLTWAPTQFATEYLVLRATPEDSEYFLIGTTTVPSYIDSNVVNGDTLIYSAIAIAPFYALDTSLPAYGEGTIVHPMPRLVSATMQAKNVIRVHTSQPPSVNQIFGGTVMVDDTVQPNAIASTADSEIVLNMSATLGPGAHRMRVNSFGLRDFLNSPFDTADYLTFEVPPDTVPNQFYIVSWTFYQGLNGLQIHVIFNEQPGANALDVSHYSLSPYGTLTSVSLDTTNPNALYIDVQGVQLVALGVPFVLCVTNITSIANTPLDATNGNCVGISLVEPDLSNVMVYPNPAKQSLGQLTFARLTAQADIRIYTLRMQFIQEITTTGSQGGAIWDLKDSDGNPVPSGEYLYYVTGSNAAGAAVQGVANKLVIVDDVK